jgi:hypothetical protein
MDVLLKVAQSREDLVRWGRYIGCVPRPRTADPVLGSSDLARILRRPSTTLKETAVGLLEESKREGKGSGLDLVHGVGKGIHVTGYFTHVFNGRSRSVGVLVAKEIGQSRLSAFDLAGQDCFFADVHVEETIRIQLERGSP